MKVKKEKITALLLALFLGFWTWLYTYQIDRWKFWLNLALSIVSLGIWAIAAWIWAVVETANRPKSFFDNYSEYLFDVGDPTFDELNYTKVEKYKLGLLLNRINSLNTIVKISSFRLIKYIPSLTLGLVCGFFVFFIFVMLALEEIIFIEGITHYYNSYYETYRLYDLWLALSSILGLITFYSFIRKYDYFDITKKYSLRKKSQLTSYLNQLELTYPDFVKQFGGMDSIKDLMLNIHSEFQ